MIPSRLPLVPAHHGVSDGDHPLPSHVVESAAWWGLHEEACAWNGCTSIIPCRTMLKEHLRNHALSQPLDPDIVCYT